MDAKIFNSDSYSCNKGQQVIEEADYITALDPDLNRTKAEIYSVSRSRFATLHTFWRNPMDVRRNINPNLPDPILKMFSINLESITFMKIKIIVYQGKSYIIHCMSKLYLETNRNTTT